MTILNYNGCQRRPNASARSRESNHKINKKRLPPGVGGIAEVQGCMYVEGAVDRIFACLDIHHKEGEERERETWTLQHGGGDLHVA